MLSSLVPLRNVAWIWTAELMKYLAFWCVDLACRPAEFLCVCERGLGLLSCRCAGVYLRKFGLQSSLGSVLIGASIWTVDLLSLLIGALNWIAGFRTNFAYWSVNLAC